MIMSNTLLIRHLSPNLSDEEKKDLIMHFGAISVKILSSKVKKTCLVFATFPSEEEASCALHRLHQLDVLGYPLTVEYAKGGTHFESDPEIKQATQVRKDDKESCQKHYETFLHKLNSWHSSLDFTQAPPAHLRYQYPPPSYGVLINIMRALASVPKFYTQTLHLMNKMNLPCPFDCVFPEPDILKSIQDPTSQTSESNICEELEMKTSTEESEIESEEDAASKNEAKDVPVKRRLPQKKSKVKRPKFVKPCPISQPGTAKPTTKPEEVFEKVELEPVQRKISLILPASECSSQPTVPDTSTTNPSDRPNTLETTTGFGLLFPSTEKTEEIEESSTELGETDVNKEKSCITSQELAANRISSRDQRHLTVFKNYQPGIPSCRLYIKNLSKQVEEKDLNYIYAKYIIPNFEEQGSMFDIRLMKEGRMKGQAFVTLQNVKQAQRALNETNGFILKDKPMVVQFARSAMAKST